MSWINVLKADFVFNPDTPARGGFKASRDPPTVINLSAFGGLKRTDEEYISSIVNTITHESSHEAFDGIANEEYYVKPLKALAISLYRSYHKIVERLLDRNSDAKDIYQDEMYTYITMLAEYNMINEIFASEAGGQEGVSRILAERYAQEGREKIEEFIWEVLVDGMQTTKKTLREQNAGLSPEAETRLINVIDNASGILRSMLNRLMKHYEERATKVILTVYLAEVESGQEPGFYNDLMRKVIREQGWEKLNEYLRTGDLSMMEEWM